MNIIQPDDFQDQSNNSELQLGNSPALQFGGFLKKNVTLGACLLIAIATGLVAYFLFPRVPQFVYVTNTANECSQKMNMLRLNDYRFTHPLMIVDIPNENAELNSLKSKIDDVLEKYRLSGVLTDASVYYRKLNDGSWFVINNEKQYTPASLMKVANLIALLRQADITPGLLDRKVYFDHHYRSGFTQVTKSFEMQEKRYYTIKELLYYMIVYSDNDAMNLITQNYDGMLFKKIFADLNIPVPAIDSVKDAEYTITAADYCKLFRVLYSSSYVSREYSEMALNLLSQSTYKEGFLKALSPGFPVSHKFGERVGNQSAQLHEVGIFYNDQQPYLLGVMTRGRSLAELAPLISEIALLVYQHTARQS